MTTQALPLSRIIRITSQITATQPLRAEFGRVMMMTTDTSQANRTGVYANILAVADDFPTTSPAYLAAQKYFGVSPFPRNLVIGRWFTIGSGATLRGGAAGTLAQIQALSNTNTLTVGGITTAVIDLQVGAGGASFAAAAAAVQAAIRAASGAINAWVTATAYAVGDAVEGSDNNFYVAVAAQLTSDDNDPVLDGGANWALAGPNLDAAAVTYDAAIRQFTVTAVGLTAFAALPVGTLAGVFGWTAAAGGVLAPGYAADANVADAVNSIVASNASWYWATHDATIAAADDLVDYATAIQGLGRYQCGVVDFAGGTLVPNESASLTARIAAAGFNRVSPHFSADNEPLALGIFARQSITDFDGLNTWINPAHKRLTGFSPDALTPAQADELERKRCNYYATFGAGARYWEGTTADPATWMDSRFTLDALVERIQLNIDNLLTATPTRIPQTDLGQAAEIAVAEQACAQWVRNGSLAPGYLEEELANDIRIATGNPDFDGFLTEGYLVYAPPFSGLSAAVTRARFAPRLRIWTNGAGGINRANGDLIFEG